MAKSRLSNLEPRTLRRPRLALRAYHKRETSLQLVERFIPSIAGKGTEDRAKAAIAKIEGGKDFLSSRIS